MRNALTSTIPPWKVLGLRENDKKRILAKLDEMFGYIVELKEMLPEEREYYEDMVKKRACEKTIELAIESLIDAAAILVSSQRFGLPESEDNLIEILVDRKVITPELGKKIREMKGFRNILIHRYGKKDDRLVYEYLTNEPQDFKRFEEEIKRYLKSVGSTVA